MLTPNRIAQQAQAIADQVTAIQGDMEMISVQDSALIQLANLLRDLALAVGSSK